MQSARLLHAADGRGPSARSGWCWSGRRVASLPTLRLPDQARAVDAATDGLPDACRLACRRADLRRRGRRQGGRGARGVVDRPWGGGQDRATGPRCRTACRCDSGWTAAFGMAMPCMQAVQHGRRRAPAASSRAARRRRQDRNRRPAQPSLVWYPLDRGLHHYRRTSGRDQASQAARPSILDIMAAMRMRRELAG